MGDSERNIKVFFAKLLVLSDLLTLVEQPSAGTAKCRVEVGHSTTFVP